MPILSKKELKELEEGYIENKEEIQIPKDGVKMKKNNSYRVMMKEDYDSAIRAGWVIVGDK